MKDKADRAVDDIVAGVMIRNLLSLQEAEVAHEISGAKTGNGKNMVRIDDHVTTIIKLIMVGHKIDQIIATSTNNVGIATERGIFSPIAGSEKITRPELIISLGVTDTRL